VATQALRKYDDLNHRRGKADVDKDERRNEMKYAALLLLLCVPAANAQACDPFLGSYMGGYGGGFQQSFSSISSFSSGCGSPLAFDAPMGYGYGGYGLGTSAFGVGGLGLGGFYSAPLAFSSRPLFYGGGFGRAAFGVGGIGYGGGFGRAAFGVGGVGYGYGRGLGRAAFGVGGFGNAAFATPTIVQSGRFNRIRGASLAPGTTIIQNGRRNRILR
jgi:hypothetical protein